MPSEITYEELEAELERLGLSERSTRKISDVAPEPGTFTVSELCAATGRSRRWIADHLRLAVREGMVEVLRRRIVDLSGRPMLIPAYRFLQKAPAWAKGGGKGGQRRGR